MKFTLVQLSAVFGFALTARSHFVLLAPTTLGFDDAVEDVSPCGSFDPKNREAGVTEWPIGGQSISVITTHLSVKWTIRAALLSDVTNFVSLVPVIDQKGVGSVCFDGIPGRAEWVGEDAVLQIYQEGVDGVLYQCAAIKFIEGGAAPIPEDCSNDTGVTWNFESPLPSSTIATSKVSSSSTTSNAEDAGPSSASSPIITSAASLSSYSSPSKLNTTPGAPNVTSTPNSTDRTTGNTYSESPQDHSSTTRQGSIPTGVSTSIAPTSTTAQPSRFTGGASKIQGAGITVLLGGGAILAWMI